MYPYNTTIKWDPNLAKPKYSYGCGEDYSVLTQLHLLSDNNGDFNIWTINGTEYHSPEIPYIFRNSDTQPLNDPLVINYQFARCVRLVIYNPSDFWHPMHIHGNDLMFLGSGVGSQIPYANLSTNPIRKHTIQVPARGWVVVQFMTDNIGWWLFHCHVDIHMEAGMGIVVHVLGSISGTKSSDWCVSTPAPMTADDSTWLIVGIAFVCLVLFLILVFIIIIVIIKKRHSNPATDQETQPLI